MGHPRQGVKQIFLDLGTYSNLFLVPENPRVPKISQFGEKKFFSRSVLSVHHPLFKMVITRQFISNLSNSFFKSCSMDHKLQFYYSFFVSFLCGHFGHGVGLFRIRLQGSNVHFIKKLLAVVLDARSSLLRHKDSILW